jgi:hypothetical protein
MGQLSTIQGGSLRLIITIHSSAKNKSRMSPRLAIINDRGSSIDRNEIVCMDPYLIGVGRRLNLRRKASQHLNNKSRN